MVRVEHMVHGKPILHCAQQKPLPVELQRSDLVPFVHGGEETANAAALLSASANPGRLRILGNLEHFIGLTMIATSRWSDEMYWPRLGFILCTR